MGNLLTKVQINSVTIWDDSDSGAPNLLINWEYERTIERGISELKMIILASTESIVSSTVGKTVSIWKGFTTSTDEKIFEGFITDVSPNGGILEIVCKDKMWDLVRKNVNNVYESSGAQAGQVSAIAKDLIETFGGLTADEQATGLLASDIIDEFRCNNTDIYERLIALMHAVNYQMWYDAANDTVHFEPRGFNDSATTLTVGTEILGVPKWINDTSRLVNNLRVDGAVSETQIRKPIGSGNGIIDTTADFDTDGITLDKTPENVELILENVNPPVEVKEGGTKDSTSGEFYYVDRQNKKVVPATSTTFTAGHRAIVNYTWLAPSPIRQRNQLSIDTYGTFEKQITLEDIQTIADAETRTSEILARFSSPFLVGDLLVKSALTISVNIGDTVRIVDAISKPNIDQDFVVTRQLIKYPASNQELIVGDEPIRLADWQLEVETRLKRIEEILSLKNQDLILELFDFANQVTSSPRYRKMFTQTYNTTNLALILGDATRGILGTNKFRAHADAFEAEVDHFVQQYQDSYTEDFIDNDFEDTSGTVTGWTSGSIDFTSGQIALSKSIDFNNSTIITATLDATEVSGDFDYELTADGSTFEQIARPFAHYKMNDNAASTTVVDAMGFQDGILNGGDNTSVLNTTGLINDALDFNGTDDYVQANIGNPTNFTYMCWFNLNIAAQDFNNPSGSLIQLMWTQDDNPRIGLRSTGILTGAIKNGAESTVQVEATNAYITDTWAHVVMTFDGTNLRLYLNGALEATSATVSGRGALTDSTRLMRDDAGRFVKGKQDDVRFYNFALSLTDIQNVYNSGFGTEGISFPHTFTATGTDLRFKITENNSTTGEISQVTIIDHH